MTERKTDTGAESVAAPRAVHTPGPWWYGIAYEAERGEQPLSYRGPGYYENAGVMAGDQTIVGCDEYDVFGPTNTAEREANVRLICAAPDLLKALESFVQAWDEYGEQDNVAVNTEWLKAVDAIKKARG